MDFDANDILRIGTELEDAKDQLRKMGIFKYDTLDEADKSKERIRGDVTIEIGGPSTHIKISVRTRKEHTIIKEAMEQILNHRLKEATNNLGSFCEGYLKK